MLEKLTVDLEGFEVVKFDYGVNLILGNKLGEEDSCNSLGKTLLLRLIDYLLGAQTNFFNYNELRNRRVTGFFRFKIGDIEISRILTEPNAPISIISSTINGFKAGDTVKIKKWTSWLGEYYWPDNHSVSFRSFSHIFSKFDSISKFEEAIKSNRNDSAQESGKRISYLLNLKAYDKISKDCSLSTNEKNVLIKISKILGKSLSDVPKSELKYIELFTDKFYEISSNLRNAKLKYEKNKSYINRLKRDLDEIDLIIPQQFIGKFDIYKKELGEFLKKNYEECYEFHKNVLNENRGQIQLKINSFIEENETLEKEIEYYQSKRDELFPDLDKNLEKEFSNENAKRYLLSKFISEKNISTLLRNAEATVKRENYNDVEALLEEDSVRILKYKKFLDVIVRIVCENNLKEFKLVYTKNNIFKILFSLPHDDGEGYGSVRSLIFLFLLLCINAIERNLDYFILDSAALDSIDKDVLTKFLIILNKLCKKLKVQFITALNIQNINKEKIKRFYVCKELTPEHTLFNQSLTRLDLNT